MKRVFLQTGHPRDLTLIHSLGIGDRDCKGTNRFAHAEMLKRIIAGHFTWSPKMQALVKNNTIEAYCFPGGVIQACYGRSAPDVGAFYPRWAGIVC